VGNAAKLRILVAEDNQDSSISLKILLEALGYEVYVAYDGEEAVRAAAEMQPDAILMDIGLPKLNGFDATRRIRAAEKPGRVNGRMLIIALTGWGQDGDRRKSAEAGIDHHLVKPLDLAALRRLLDSLQKPAPG
jgi:CheY-like chemotaxis protein